MTCEFVKLADGTTMIVCNHARRRAKPCACGASSVVLCDGPRATGSGTCDQPLCHRCRIHVPPNLDFCHDHRRQAALAAAQLRLLPEGS